VASGLGNKILLGVIVVVAGLFFYTGFHTSKALSKNTQQEKGPITIYLAGDSTVSTYPKSISPRSGWGQEFALMFDDQIIVNNQAKPSRSSKSFIEEGRLTWILTHIKKGDYLFIQFGHNDEKIFDPKRYTIPSTTYKSYLKQYIDGARKKGAIPILVTPVERMGFSEDGGFLSTHGRYPAAMKELGQEEKVPVINLTAKSKAMFQKIGPEKTKKLFLWLKAGEYPNYPNGVMDSTHFQVQGAREIAKLVMQGIEEQNLPLKDHVLEVYR
jgi:lysophospholipase L1-like esterase